MICIAIHSRHYSNNVDILLQMAIYQGYMWYWICKSGVFKVHTFLKMTFLHKPYAPYITFLKTVMWPVFIICTKYLYPQRQRWVPCPWCTLFINLFLCVGYAVFTSETFNVGAFLLEYRGMVEQFDCNTEQALGRHMYLFKSRGETYW